MILSAMLPMSMLGAQAIMRLLAEHGKPIAAVVGRFYGVYNRNRRAYLCDEAVSGGIIVQQVGLRACQPEHVQPAVTGRTDKRSSFCKPCRDKLLHMAT